jgi:hypothetical protein
MAAPPDKVDEIDLAEQIAGVEREIAMRVRVYARLIAAGKMSAATAERHTNVMRAVLRTLERVQRIAPSRTDLFPPPVTRGDR